MQTNKRQKPRTPSLTITPAKKLLKDLKESVKRAQSPTTATKPSRGGLTDYFQAVSPDEYRKNAAEQLSQHSAQLVSTGQQKRGKRPTAESQVEVKPFEIGEPEPTGVKSKKKRKRDNGKSKDGDAQGQSARKKRRCVTDQILPSSQPVKEPVEEMEAADSEKASNINFEQFQKGEDVEVPIPTPQMFPVSKTHSEHNLSDSSAYVDPAQAPALPVASPCASPVDKSAGVVNSTISEKSHASPPRPEEQLNLQSSQEEITPAEFVPLVNQEYKDNEDVAMVNIMKIEHTPPHEGVVVADIAEEQKQEQKQEQEPEQEKAQVLAEQKPAPEDGVMQDSSKHVEELDNMQTPAQYFPMVPVQGPIPPSLKREFEQRNRAYQRSVYYHNLELRQKEAQKECQQQAESGIKQVQQQDAEEQGQPLQQEPDPEKAESGNKSAEEKRQPMQQDPENPDKEQPMGAEAPDEEAQSEQQMEAEGESADKKVFVFGRSSTSEMQWRQSGERKALKAKRAKSKTDKKIIEYVDNLWADIREPCSLDQQDTLRCLKNRFKNALMAAVEQKSDKGCPEYIQHFYLDFCVLHEHRCSLCSRLFSCRQSRWRHEKHHLGPGEDTLHLAIPKLKRTGTDFACLVCGYTDRKAYRMQIHLHKHSPMELARFGINKPCKTLQAVWAKQLKKSHIDVLQEQDLVTPFPNPAQGTMWILTTEVLKTFDMRRCLDDMILRVFCQVMVDQDTSIAVRWPKKEYGKYGDQMSYKELKKDLMKHFNSPRYRLVLWPFEHKGKWYLFKREHYGTNIWMASSNHNNLENAAVLNAMRQLLESMGEPREIEMEPNTPTVHYGYHSAVTLCLNVVMEFNYENHHEGALYCADNATMLKARRFIAAIIKEYAVTAQKERQEWEAQSCNCNAKRSVKAARKLNGKASGPSSSGGMCTRNRKVRPQAKDM